MVCSFFNIFPPCERAMVSDEYAGRGFRINLEITEGFSDHFSRISFVVVFPFFFREGSGTGNGSVEIVCMGRANRDDRPSGLCEGCGVNGMGVDDSADFREVLVQFNVGPGI